MIDGRVYGAARTQPESGARSTWAGLLGDDWNIAATPRGAAHEQFESH